jgi:hypothetical protein
MNYYMKTGITDVGTRDAGQMNFQIIKLGHLKLGQLEVSRLPKVVDQNRIFSLSKTLLVDQKSCALIV